MYYNDFYTKYAVKQQVIGETLMVCWSDKTISCYDAVALGCEWFHTSNDLFYDKYKFNFNPHQWRLYEECRKLAYGGKA